MQASWVLHCAAASAGSKDSGLWLSIGCLFVRFLEAKAEDVCVVAVGFKSLRCMIR